MKGSTLIYWQYVQLVYSTGHQSYIVQSFETILAMFLCLSSLHMYSLPPTITVEGPYLFSHQ